MCGEYEPQIQCLHPLQVEVEVEVELTWANRHWTQASSVSPPESLEVKYMKNFTQWRVKWRWYGEVIILSVYIPWGYILWYFVVASCLTYKWWPGSGFSLSHPFWSLWTHVCTCSCTNSNETTVGALIFCVVVACSFLSFRSYVIMRSWC